MFDLQINNQCKLNASFMRISDLKLHSVNCKLRNAIYGICIKEKVDAEKPERSHALMFFVSVLEWLILE